MISRNNTTGFVSYPVLAAMKTGGKFTEGERAMLRERAWASSLDHGTRTHTGTDSFGNEFVLVFDIYMVGGLGPAKRLRHALRMLGDRLRLRPRVKMIIL